MMNLIENIFSVIILGCLFVFIAYCFSFCYFDIRRDTLERKTERFIYEHRNEISYNRRLELEKVLFKEIKIGIIKNKKQLKERFQELSK